MSGYHRDVGPVLKWFRNWCLGRQWNHQLRYQEQLSPRPYPPANLPQGPSDKASDNYYCTRDGRRESRLPVVIPINVKQIASATDSQQKASVAKTRPPVPGNVHRMH